MRKKSKNSLRGSVELALTGVEEFINSAEANDISDEIIEKVKVGIFEPLKRAQMKLPGNKNKTEVAE